MNRFTGTEQQVLEHETGQNYKQVAPVFRTNSSCLPFGFWKTKKCAFSVPVSQQRGHTPVVAFAPDTKAWHALYRSTNAARPFSSACAASEWLLLHRTWQNKVQKWTIVARLKARLQKFNRSGKSCCRGSPSDATESNKWSRLETSLKRKQVTTQANRKKGANMHWCAIHIRHGSSSQLTIWFAGTLSFPNVLK